MHCVIREFGATLSGRDKVIFEMRTVAEDRRAGTWEVLLTAPVGEGAAVVGAWLALGIWLVRR